MGLFNYERNDTVYGEPIGNQKQWAVSVTSNSQEDLTKALNSYCYQKGLELLQISLAYCYQESWEKFKAMAIVRRK